MIQERKAEIPRLLESYNDHEARKEIRENLLQKVDTYINCLRGEFTPQTPLPDYLVPT
jgi:hypothetical protein